VYQDIGIEAHHPERVNQTRWEGLLVMMEKELMRMRKEIWA